MRLVLNVLGVLLIASFFDSLLALESPSSNEVNTQNTQQTICGQNEICIPEYLCNGGKIKVHSEPQISPQSEPIACGPNNKCCVIDNQPLFDYNCSQQYSELELPYYGLLSQKNFGVGKSIHAEVRVKLEPSYFVIRLQKGQNVWPEPITAFYLNVSQQSNGTIEVNSYSNNSWGQVLFWKWDTDLNEGKSFRLDIVHRAPAIEVYVNGKLIGEFPHRVQLDMMDTLNIFGDIHLGNLVIETYTPTNTLQKSIYRDYDVDKPLHIYSDLGVIKEGVTFTITGYIPPICERFSINLMSEQNNVFHFNPRLDEREIILNSQAFDEDWGEEESFELPSSLRRNSKFTIQILVKENEFLVAVNGRHWCDFKHRYPYTTVSSVIIVGDVDAIQLNQTKISIYPKPTPESGPKQIQVVS